ncbi:MAG: PA domain-containing protein [Flavobacteriales bacterium]
MRKLLLTVAVAFLASASSAQIIFYVNSPAAIEGNYPFDRDGAGWGIPDMNQPQNAINNEDIIFVGDGSAADSLCCGPVTTPGVTGKVAVIYRGTCEFGVKALNAQNAGAVGVIIINNAPGTIPMGAGAQGANVTIPIAMLSNSDGALLRTQYDAGETVNIFFGSKSGFYGDDIGFYNKDVLKPKTAAAHALLSQNGSEYSVLLGGWVFNYGSNNQTGVTLTAEIDLGGNTLYTQTSNPVAINSGDSVYLALPAYSPASYGNGLHTVTYTVAFTGVDEFPQDNVVEASFFINDTIISYAKVDPVTGRPSSNTGLRPNGAQSYSQCMAFRDANASRLKAIGTSFAAYTNAANNLVGQFVDIEFYRWNDNFVDLNDPNFSISNLQLVAATDYIYDSDLQGVSVYAQFNNFPQLIDNQRYLLCVSSFDANVFLGFDTQTDYDLNVDEYLQAYGPVNSDGQFFALGFGTDMAPGIGLHAVSINSPIGVVENERLAKITPYPNPTNEFVNIPFNSAQTGLINLDILDITGRLVSTQRVNITNNSLLTVNTNQLENGNYIFSVRFDDGAATSFKVVISR